MLNKIIITSLTGRCAAAIPTFLAAQLVLALIAPVGTHSDIVIVVTTMLWQWHCHPQYNTIINTSTPPRPGRTRRTSRSVWPAHQVSILTDHIDTMILWLSLIFTHYILAIIIISAGRRECGPRGWKRRFDDAAGSGSHQIYSTEYDECWILV